MAHKYIPCKARPSAVMIRNPGVRMLWVAVLVVAVSGQNNPGTAGFISIDCGARSGHADTRTQIQWMPDTLQIGRYYNLSMTNIDKDLQTLRAFPSGYSSRRNCYSIPARSGTAYLIRASFLYGNYDRQSRPPKFSLYLDSTLWQEVDLSSNKAEHYEAITSPDRVYPLGTISVCLLRTINQMAPIINSLELRPLPNSTYVARLHQLAPSSQNIDVNLYLIARINFGGSFFRYPQDKFDRFWSPFSVLSDVRGLRVLSAPRNQTFSWPSGPVDSPPDEVVQTAITSQSISFTLPWFPADPFQAYLSLFSCEFSPPTGNRKIEIEWSLYTNERDAYMPFVPNYDSEVTLDRPFWCKQYGMGNYSMNSNLSLKLGKTSPASADPVLNALELYSIATVRPGACDNDVQALIDLKQSLNVSFDNWVGDPCLPSPWDELQCSSNSPPRVTSLDLSGMKASGPIPTSIGKLTALERLSLANNSFSGSIPDLSTLQSLSTLNLASNRLSGMFPSWLEHLPNLIRLDIRNNDIIGAYPHSIASNLGSNFSFDGNENLCDASTPWCISKFQIPPTSPRDWASPPEQDKNKTDFILGVGAGILITVLVANTLFIIYCIFRCRTPKYHKPSESGWPAPVSGMQHHGIDIEDMDSMVHQMYPTERRLRAQCYPYNAIKSATNGFAEKLGAGGFGAVYYGVLSDSQQVAVKVMPVKSKRETQEILDELDVLSVGLHKNVVPLVGYSQNVDEILFIYAYMPEGELQSRLYGPNAASRPLTWKERLGIAINAAEGLEFLHHTCKPAIVHRNVKSTNIFLSRKLEGKVGHYGISKLAMEDEATGNMASVVNKTRGYLDPEYYATRQLSAKSDIYSFGVLLLEILCGRSPILDPKSSATGNCSNVVDWVRNSLQKGSVEGIMDPALRGHYNLATAWNIAEIAIHCVEMKSKSRPTMTEVVLDLTRAVDMDANGEVKPPTIRTYTNPFIFHSPHNLPAV